MDPIEEFVSRYVREYDFYAEAARMASEWLKAELDAAGVRAIVTHRAKDAHRLEAKCRKRAHKTPYGSISDIYDDIVDLAGVRIALYFPGERGQVEKSVENLFDRLEPPKQFPEAGNQRAGKRFTGYSAVHYRVRLKEELLPDSAKRYAAARVEIQVASVLMHAWAEVEHDLAYKPLEVGLSDEEEAILDEINGLVLTGEIALERLERAGKERSSASGRRFMNHYDLAAYLLGQASTTLNGPVSDSGLGRVDQLFEMLATLEIDTPEKLSPYIQALHGNVELRPLAEQVVDELLTEDGSRYDVYRAIQKNSRAWDPPEESRGTMELGRFVATWVILEDTVRRLAPAEVRKSPMLPPRRLVALGMLDGELANELDELRDFRSRLVHRHERLAPVVIAKATESLKEIIAKIRPPRERSDSSVSD
ncbi:hypothetical protein SAMN05421812_102251 [Asanoa hainanensis]|uniref:RelA/SpoT domain-containing protein n=1 Tax=Asanoa hainanensis TaxID=560556 RepID=A0A239I6V8_9ACTN|nr:RelA/SpoT domain-containing protein [Asanoa hainanensis]SNS89330.1 hypothetical protein SAMN05421812_102251 [Asanoa hainanensis]